MAEFKFRTRGVAAKDLPAEFVAEYREDYMRQQPDTDDERFDLALDIVMGNQNFGPYAELDEHFGDDDEKDAHYDDAVEIAREWAYEVLIASGHPYGRPGPDRNPSKGLALGVAALAVATGIAYWLWDKARKQSVAPS